MELSNFLLPLIIAVTFANGRRTPTTLRPCDPALEEDIPCGSFVQYFDHDEVIEFGFSAGRYKDGSQAYVGMGFDPRCEDSHNNPARLKATGDKKGAYMSCVDETYDDRTMRYLKNHPSLKWVENQGSVEHKRNLVRIKSGRYDFWFGRKQLTDSFGQSFYVVSKVFRSGDMLYSIVSGDQVADDIEVLSC